MAFGVYTAILVSGIKRISALAPHLLSHRVGVLCSDVSCSLVLLMAQAILHIGTDLQNPFPEMDFAVYHIH